MRGSLRAATTPGDHQPGGAGGLASLRAECIGWARRQPRPTTGDRFGESSLFLSDLFAGLEPEEPRTWPSAPRFMGRFQAVRFLALLLAFGGLATTRADLLEVPVAADTGLLEYAPVYNLGAQPDVPAGTLGTVAGQTRSRLLVRFEVSTVLPAGARIQSAFLRLSVTREPAVPAPSRFALHRMLVSWREGTKEGSAPGGAKAEPGETTWDERLAGQAAWGEPGGRAGGDFEAAASASETVGGAGTYEFELGARGVADIQGWLADPTNNQGWIVVAEDEATARTARRFAARESGRGALLIIRFTTGTAAPRITGFEVRGDKMILRFLGETGQDYVWEGTTALEGDGLRWETIQEIEPALSPGEREVTNVWPALPRQYFRLLAPSQGVSPRL